MTKRSVQRLIDTLKGTGAGKSKIELSSAASSVSRGLQPQATVNQALSLNASKINLQRDPNRSKTPGLIRKSRINKTPDA